MRRGTAAASVLLMSALLTFTGVGAAGAIGEGSIPPDNQPDRVVYVDAPAPLPASDAHVVSSTTDGTSSLTVVEGDDFPVKPAAGETVRVVYTNAVADVTALAGCTHSVTVNTPYTLSGKLYVTGFAMVSTGCASSQYFSLYLYKNLSLTNQTSTTVPNDGASHGLGLVRTCTSTSSNGYVAIGTLASGGSTWGPGATLACDY